jgi:hypothetical protein
VSSLACSVFANLHAIRATTSSVPESRDGLVLSLDWVRTRSSRVALRVSECAWCAIVRESARSASGISCGGPTPLRLPGTPPGWRSEADPASSRDRRTGRGFPSHESSATGIGCSPS